MAASASSSNKTFDDENRISSKNLRDNKTDDAVSEEDEFKDMGKETVTNTDHASIVLGIDGEPSSKRIRECPSYQNKINLFWI
mmetsp:Transcript_21408/g.32526  ORF Transcript_21408/g.32526 Transcript_21408/m.32526 type:complete len:83 (+) Transcript_21408:179-427(+)